MKRLSSRWTSPSWKAAATLILVIAFAAATVELVQAQDSIDNPPAPEDGPAEGDGGPEGPTQEDPDTGDEPAEGDGGPEGPTQEDPNTGDEPAEGDGGPEEPTQEDPNTGDEPAEGDGGPEEPAQEDPNTGDEPAEGDGGPEEPTQEGPNTGDEGINPDNPDGDTDNAEGDPENGGGGSPPTEGGGTIDFDEIDPDLIDQDFIDNLDPDLIKDDPDLAEQYDQLTGGGDNAAEEDGKDGAEEPTGEGEAGQAPDGEEGQREEGEVPEGEEGQREEGEAPDGQEGQREEGEAPDGQEGQREEGEAPDGEEGQREEGEAPDGEEGQREEGEAPDGEEGQREEGEAPEGEEGQREEGEAPEGEKGEGGEEGEGDEEEEGGRRGEEDNDEYEYEFTEDEEVEEYKPDEGFKERLVEVDLDAILKNEQEEEEENANKCERPPEEDEGDIAEGPQGLIYVPDFNVNPLIITFELNIPGLVEASGANRRLHESHTGRNITDEVTQALKAAAVGIVEKASVQLLDNGFSEDNVEVVVGNIGNVSAQMRFPLGTPTAVVQTVKEFMIDDDKGLADQPALEQDDGDVLSMADLYGEVELVNTQYAEITDNDVIRLRVVTQRDYAPWWYRDATTGLRQGIVKELISAMNASIQTTATYVQLQALSDDKLPYDKAGLIEMLSNGTADVAIGPTMLSAEDMTRTGLAAPWLTTGHILIIPSPRITTPKISSKNFVAFLRPFTTGLWLTILGCVVLAGIILWILERDAEHSDEHDFLPEDGNAKNLMKSLWLSLGTYNAALVTHSPLTTLGRLLSISYALLVFVIINSYTANLASYLVTEGAVHYSVDSLQEANEWGAPICIFANSTAAQMAKIQYPNINFVYIDITNQDNSLAMEEAKEKLFGSDCAGFVVEEHIGHYYLNNPENANATGIAYDTSPGETWCDLMQKGERLVLQGNYGVPVNYNLPKDIQMMLENAVESIRDSGLLASLIKSNLETISQCEITDASDAVPQLKVVDLFGVIVIFFTMAAISSIQLLWTFFLKPYMRGRPKQTVLPTLSEVDRAAPQQALLKENAWPPPPSDDNVTEFKMKNEAVGESVSPSGRQEPLWAVKTQSHEVAVLLPQNSAQSGGEISPADKRCSSSASENLFPRSPAF